MTTLGFLLMLGMSLLAACGGGGSAAAPPPVSTPAPTPLPTASPVLPSPVAAPVAILPAADVATALAEGPDGNVWFTARSSGGSPGTGAQAGRYAVASGTVTHFPLPNADADPNLVTAGPDGAVWFFEQNRTRFARITTGGALQEFGAAFQVSAMTAGPDGNVWFLTAQSPPQIGKITPAGTITTYVLPPDGFAPALSAAAGRLWLFAAGASANGSLASIATDGTGYAKTPLSQSLSSPATTRVMYAGKDGNFYADAAPALGTTIFRITPAGVVTGLCGVASAGGGNSSAVLDDGSITFASFGIISAPAFATVLPSGNCQTGPFASPAPLGLGARISGGGDGFLYVYRPSDGTLTKYAH